MTITIDGIALKVSALSLRIVPVASETDEMVESTFKHITRPFGAYRQFEIEGVEESTVAWSNSIVKYLQDKAQAGSSVNLVIDETAYSFNGYVWIMDISADFEKNARLYRVMLQEVM
jgi:hypothetical protein